MLFRLYLLIAIASLLFFKPISYIVGCYRRKRKLMKYVEHLPSPKEYPLVGVGNQFFWKNNEGEHSELKWINEITTELYRSPLLFSKKKCRDILSVILLIAICQWLASWLASWPKTEENIFVTFGVSME